MCRDRTWLTCPSVGGTWVVSNLLSFVNHAAMNKGASNYLGNMCACALSRSAASNSLQPRGLRPARLLCPWDFPGENTAVGCHSLLRGIFPTQGSNACFPVSCVGRWVLLHYAARGAVDLLGHVVILVSPFQESPGCSVEAAPLCTPTSASWGFQLLHIHTNGTLFSFIFFS